MLRNSRNKRNGKKKTLVICDKKMKTYEKS